MTFFRAILRFLFSRTMLTGLLILGFGVGIWFLGPYLGIGASRPLETASARVVVLVFSLSLLLFWLLRWPVSIVGVTALCLLIWYGAPLLRVGDAQPFAPEWTRLLTVCLLGGCFAVYLLYRFWQALRANEDLLQKLLHPRFGKTDSAAREQIQELQSIMQRAMGHLRTLRTNVSGFARLIQGNRFIYELPWYMILGAPGAGKTTAILHSGLTFPFADQLGAAALNGVSGTRNCVWWFTNEAVLIDTAGRYATHETNLEVDAAEWKGFLGLLRKYRPRAPINGVILTVSTEDLLHRNAAERGQLAANLRERLLELQTELGIRFPVYVMITKMDRLKGFQTCFHNLNHEGRAQVWGFTLPYAETRSQSIADIRELYAGEMTLLIRRLEQGLTVRLREEYATERRRDLYCLPDELNGLTEPLLQLVERVFFESRYSEAHVQSSPRGIYFTSAVQGDSALPTDQTTLLQRFRQLIRTGQEWVDPVSRTRSTLHASTGDRSYFLHDMLQRVIFPEAFLVRPNRRWEWRFLLVRSLGHILLLVLCAGLAGAMLTSHANNTSLLQTMAEREQLVRDNLSRLRGDETQTGQSDLSEAQWKERAFVLHQVCSLTEDAGIDLAEPPFTFRAGLYSLDAVAQAAQETCKRLQERFLLPQATARLETRFRTALAAVAVEKEKHGENTTAQDMLLYDALRVYLLYYDETRFQPEALLDWFAEDMKRFPDGHFLIGHPLLPTYLEQTLRRAPVRPVPYNAELVTQARVRLQRSTREERLYSLAKSVVSGAEAFIPARHMDESGMRLLYLASGRSLSEGIPGLFTYDGYHETFEPKLTLFVPDAVRDDLWIMGDAEAGTSLGTLFPQQTAQKISRLYFREYAAIWKRFIEDIHVRSGTLAESSLETLRVLGSGNSPLDQLAKAVTRETTLSFRKKDLTVQVADMAVRKAKSRTNTTGLHVGSLDAVRLVDTAFTPLHKVVLGTDNPEAAHAPVVPDSPELSTIRGLFSEYAAYMQEVIRATNAQSLTPPRDVADRMLAKAAQVPPFFSTALTELAQGGMAQEGETRGRTLMQLAEAQVGAPCRRQLENRYPFNPEGRDADPDALTTLLDSGGAFDAFFQKHLATLVNTESSPWTYHLPVSGAPDLTTFEQAAALRDILFRGAGREWSLNMTISVVEMDSRIERLDMQFGETLLRYEHGPSKPVQVVWQGDSAVAELEIRPKSLGVRPLKERGPWAFLRLLHQGQIERTEQPDRFWLLFDLEGHQVTLEIRVPEENLLTTELLEDFVCLRANP